MLFIMNPKHSQQQRPRRLAVAAAAVGLLLFNPSENLAREIEEFDLPTIAQRAAGHATLVQGKASSGSDLWFTPSEPAETLELWKDGDPGDWEEANYLVCEVWHTNVTSAILNLDFHRKDLRAEREIVQQGEQSTSAASQRPRISPKIGVLPGLRTQVIFPLSYLEGQEIFMRRFPRQLKGTVMGSRLRREEVAAVRLRLNPVEAPDYRSTLRISRVFLTHELPAPLPAESFHYVDEFGQWARKDWPGKIRDEEHLRAQLQELESGIGTACYPTNWSRYGGWKDRRFKATGYFRTEHDGSRWWLVDPEGCAFLSAGVTCVQPGIVGATQGQEDLFAWLPDVHSRFADAVSQRGVDFLKANLIRVYGADWRGHWERLTAGLLVKAGFNTVANWSDLDFARGAKLPYMLPMREFPRTQTLLYRDFPDVFSPEYEASAKRFARQLEEYRNDPYLIGYFLSNEPHWAFGRNNLAFEMFATEQPSMTRTRFIGWLRERYHDDLHRFNQAWAIELGAFEDLREGSFRDVPSEVAGRDFWDFSGLMVKRYIDMVCDAVEAVDPNHLNLGMRYAWVSSDLLYRAGERFDVFSINGYSFPAPPDTGEITRRSGKPVIIGEFHFGATDRGLPATGIQGVASQTDRARAYAYYVELGFARPEVVGLHYFQWMDQPINGRFDGENYNIGFMDIGYRPYPELMEGARATHERIYSIAAGKLTPTSVQARRAPQIYY